MMTKDSQLWQEYDPLYIASLAAFIYPLLTNNKEKIKQN